MPRCYFISSTRPSCILFYILVSLNTWNCVSFAFDLFDLFGHVHLFYVLPVHTHTHRPRGSKQSQPSFSAICGLSMGNVIARRMTRYRGYVGSQIKILKVCKSYKHHSALHLWSRCSSVVNVRSAAGRVYSSFTLSGGGKERRPTLVPPVGNKGHKSTFSKMLHKIR